MASKRPTTIAEYIRAAPREGQPHLRRLHAILKSVAPEAEEAIEWGTPFFVEPRFLFAFSAHKAHLDFTPTAAGHRDGSDRRRLEAGVGATSSGMRVGPEPRSWRPPRTGSIP